jgi:hypothetical protein
MISLLTGGLGTREGRLNFLGMPRFFLHYRDGTGLSKDSVGVTVPDVEAAYAEALGRARDVLERLSYWPSDLMDEMVREMAFEIADEAGRIVEIVSFLAAIGPMH